MTALAAPARAGQTAVGPLILLHGADRRTILRGRRHPRQIGVQRRVGVLGAFDALECVIGPTLHQQPAPDAVAQRVAVRRQRRAQLAQPRGPALAVLHFASGELQQDLPASFGRLPLGQRAVDPGAGLLAPPRELKAADKRLVSIVRHDLLCFLLADQTCIRR